MFEKVTYEFYSETLGRSVIPNAETFTNYKLENIQFFNNVFAPYMVAEVTDGVDSAVCLMIELDYIAHEHKDDAINSESLSGHSVSYDTTEHQLNAKSMTEKKYEKACLFCTFDAGAF